MSDVAVTDVAHHGHDDHPPTSTGISNEKLGMWVFLASECLLFGGLISTFILYRGKTDGGPPLHETFNIAFTSASSFVLLMSSLTMVLAVSALAKRDIRSTRIWLGVTALLGMLFISGQIYEFYEFVTVAGYGFTSSPAWSAFFGLTGFHGAHVTIGIVMLVTCLALTFTGRVNGDNPESVEIVGLYWHFVDVVWIIVFTVVYLIK